MSKLEIAAALVDLYEAPRPLDPHWNVEVGRLVLELNSGFFPNIVNALNGGPARAVSLQLKPDGGTWRATLSDPTLLVKAQNSGLTPAEMIATLPFVEGADLLATINLLDELLAGWEMETSPLTKAAKSKLGLKQHLEFFGYRISVDGVTITEAKREPLRPVTHELKTWPLSWQAVASGRKKFEVRLNDRAFKEGDFVILNEFDPVSCRATGRSLARRIGYLIHLAEFPGFPNAVAFELIG